MSEKFTFRCNLFVNGLHYVRWEIIFINNQKVSIIKIRSLYVSLSFPQFYRETTLRTPRQLPDTAQIEKVRFLKIAL